MFRLCVDARMAFCSGIGTYIREIVPFLKKHFSLLLLVDEIGKKWCEGMEEIQFRAPIYSLQEQWLFRKVVPPCDLFWSPHYNVPLFPIRAQKRAVTIHDVCHLRYGNLWQKGYANVLMRRALQSETVLTVSEFSKKEIQHFFGPRPLHTIHIGVNPKTFSPRATSQAIRGKYSLPEQYALFVGSLKPHKNLKKLKEAFLEERLPLVCIGNGLQSVEEEDLSSIYSMAEILIFPSLYEGFGLPPLEAMSSGCPVAASFRASIPEVCAEAASYFDPESAEEIRRAIREVLLKREEWVAKGRQRASLFSWEKTAQKHIDLFLGELHA